uniref:alanine--tRNA ligase n=1 Tax=Glossina pallidipes TaxID=7398 RepID=A0A1A9Z197_GLOPL
MHQFKNIFLGLEEIKYPCVATAQRCMRAGGKHNDLNVVGKTTIHHTFFEMLGNFSFGAYSKVEAIQLAWELLTGKKWFNLPKEKLLVTVYYKDITSYDIWINKTNINPKHIMFIKDKKDKPYHSDNFWTMGDYGPCGPCSEIFYCFGKIHTINNTFLQHQCIEIWNLVFMQFNLEADEKTPFYGESGGQAGDSGILKSSNGVFNVIDTKKNGNVFVHIGKMMHGQLNIGDTVTALINQEKRLFTTLNHSAIHLLNSALRHILGITVVQRGSLVKENYLSLDFTYHDKINIKKIHIIEDMVNMQIRNNLKISVNHMSFNDALKIGAIALFEKNYHKEVRVVKIGNFSTELCGGTHVQRTGEIGCFIIISEKKIAAGIHRIKAVTGKYAINFFQNNFDLLNSIQHLMQSNISNVFEKITQMKNNLESQRKKIFELNNIKVKNLTLAIFKNIKIIKNTQIIIDHIQESLDKNMLRLVLNKLKEKLKNSIIILAHSNKNQVNIVVSVTKKVSKHIQANDIIVYFKTFHTIKGGGNAYFSEASGTVKPTDLQSMFEAIFVVLSKKL